MPRYYFDLFDGSRRIADEHGIELPGDDAVQEQTLNATRELKESEYHGSTDWVGWRMRVVDGSGRQVLDVALDQEVAGRVLAANRVHEVLPLRAGNRKP